MPLAHRSPNAAGGHHSGSEIVTTSDTVDLVNPSHGLYIGVAGDVTLRLVDDTADVLFKAMPVGYYPFQVKRIKATATTATNIVALF